MFIQILNPVGQARYQNLSLIDSGAIARISEWQTGKWGGRVLYNKATYFAVNFVRNYISYLSPNFYSGMADRTINLVSPTQVFCIG